VWVLDQDVQMDLVGPLARGHVTGRFEASVESALRTRPALIRAAVRDLVLSNFPATVAPDVLEASVAGHGERPVCSAGSWLAWAEDFEDDPQQQRHAKEQAGVTE
jgi:hypothetical protein